MDLEMVFNELSLEPLAPDIPTARIWMSDLISTMLTAQKQGLKGIRTQTNFHDLFLAENYPLKRWRNDQEVSREQQTFLRTLVTKTPFSVDIIDSDLKRNIEDEDYEVIFLEKKAEGLKAAYLLETIAISFNSQNFWNCTRLESTLIQIENDINITEEIIEVYHASYKSHVLEHADWIKKRLQPFKINGIQLWNCRNELFPSLQFCQAGTKQFRKLRSGEDKLEWVVETLEQLEEFAKNWISQGCKEFSLEGYSLDVSGESKPTLDQYSQERTFLCPDGVYRIFDQHIKLKQCNWRIHFFLERKTEKVIIGYVGVHLPTVKHPT